MSTTTTIPTSFPQEFTPGNVKSAMAAAGASSGDLWRVPIADIHVVPGLNVRSKNDEYEAHVESIAQSIFEEGYYQDKPLGVFVDDKGRICIRDGHSRFEAAKRAIEKGAQISVLPCVTVPKGTTMEDIMVSLVKGNAGKPLLPIETAVVCKRLVGWGKTPAEVATRLGLTAGYVNDLLGLLEAPKALQTLVAAGKVSASTAIKTSKREGAKEAAEILTAASKANADNGGKVSLKHVKPAKKERPAEVDDPHALRTILKAVFNDKNFAKLADKVQCRVIDIVG